jgi:hypothetical protein
MSGLVVQAMCNEKFERERGDVKIQLTISVLQLLDQGMGKGKILSAP